MRTIAKPFGILMNWFYQLTGNYLLSVILFSLVVKLILMPFQMKSKKGMMRQTLLQPRLAEIQKKHGANKQKYQEEVQKLYQEEGVSPMSGCIWALIPYPILIALYYAIRYPLTIMMGVASDLLAEGGAIAEKLTSLGFASASSGYLEIEQAKFISAHWSSFEGLSDKLYRLNYESFGLDLSSTPSWKIWNWDWSSPSTWVPMVFLFLIPLIAAFFTWYPSKVAQKMSENTAKAVGVEQDPSANPNGGLMIMMPIITLVFAFMMPAAMGVYWIANSVFGMVQDIVLTKHYRKRLVAENAVRIEQRKVREAELEAKRVESEKRRAENATSENASTSKRKQQNKKKQARSEKAQEWERTHSADGPAYEPSRVGSRRYARGRAYNPDRFAANGIVGATSGSSRFDDNIADMEDSFIRFAQIGLSDGTELSEGENGSDAPVREVLPDSDTDDGTQSNQ